MAGEGSQWGVRTPGVQYRLKASLLYPTHQQHEPLVKHLDQHVAEISVPAGRAAPRSQPRPPPSEQTVKSALASLNRDGRRAYAKCLVETRVLRRRDEATHNTAQSLKVSSTIIFSYT